MVKRTRLSEDRERKLNDIGFTWQCHARSDKADRNVCWEDRFKQLVAYKKEHGDCKVRQLSGPLGTWVKHQRNEYRNKCLSQKSSLTDEKEKKLEQLGFEWKIRDARRSWEEVFEDLRSYKERFGHCNVRAGRRIQGFVALV